MEFWVEIKTPKSGMIMPSSYGAPSSKVSKLKHLPLSPKAFTVDCWKWYQM